AAMPAEAEARLLAEQARAFLSGNFWANDPGRALPPAEAALALLPESPEYNLLVLRVIERQFADWLADQKQTERHWGDAMLLLRRAAPLAERVAAAQGRNVDWP